MPTSELEQLADAMYLTHELLRRAESGKSGIAITKSLSSGVSLGAFGRGAKRDHSRLDMSLKIINDNLPREEKYVTAVQTLKKYSNMNSVKSLLDELYKTFPDSGLDKI